MTYNELVARYVSLWSVLEQPALQPFSMQALLGLRYLVNGDLATSQEIFEELEFHTSTPAALSYVMRGIAAFLRSLALLTFLFGYFIFAPIWTDMLLVQKTPVVPHLISSFQAFGGTLGRVLLAAVAGMLGSVVSLLLRLSEFENTKGRSQVFLFLTGATLPIVGGVFGAFTAVLFSAKVVNISIGDTSGDVGLYLVIGFLSGFSERFSRGFISVAERQLGGGSEGSRKSRRKPK